MRRKRLFFWSVVSGASLVLCFQLLVDPRLLHHAQRPVFRTGWGPMEAALARPGGASEYLADFLSQAYVWPWAGATVLAAACLAVCLAGGAVLARVRPGAAGLALLAAVPLASLHAGVDYPLAPTIALALGLGLAAGWAWLRLGGWWLRAGACVVLAVAAYHLAGGAMLVYGATCATYGLAARRRWSIAPLAAVACAVVPYAWSQLAGPAATDLAGQYFLPLPFRYAGASPVAAVALLGLFPLLTVLLAVRPWRWLPAAAARPRFVGGWLIDGLGALALAGACAGAAWVSFDADRARAVRIDNLAARGDWAGVLREADRLDLRHYGPCTACEVDRALFHTGRLSTRMFAYPHKLGMPGLTLYVGTRHVPADGWMCLKTSDLLFELGYVSEAEHMAYEALELLSEHPAVLERLFLVHAVKGETEAAETFLAALEAAPLHAPRAWAYRRMLRADPTLDGLAPVRQCRRRMPRQDGAIRPSVEQILVHLLNQDPTNRMAFEYLMAHHLLTRDLPKVASTVLRLRQFGETEVPRHWEEALMLYAYELRARNIRRPIPLPGLRLRPGAQQRLERFLQARARYGSDPNAALRGLRADYGESYYFYHTFGTTQGGAP